MKIKRTTATSIMKKAVDLHQSCMVGILDPDENFIVCDSYEDLKNLLESHTNAILLYNQNPDASDIIDKIEHADNQYSIEIFEDTEGVFGLRAYQQLGKVMTPISLELEDMD